MSRRLATLLGAALAGAIAAPVSGSEADGIAEYTAGYEVRYKGRRVASARFSVAAAGEDYVFTSSTRARGLLRLVSPNPAIERSRFELVDGAIRPLTFEYEDGSRKGEDSYALAFNPADDAIHVTGGEQSSTLPYAADLLDRGSLQVALMRDAAACTMPGPYRYVDDGGVRTYEYERLDDMATETGMGTLAAVRFAQEREGSSRRTVLWLAPGLAYLPARIEQIRDGEVETVFTLDSVTGIEASAARCSGFR